MFMFKSSQQNTPFLSPREAKARLDSGEPLFLLDVRTPEEYEEVHIPHSISLPLDRLKRDVGGVIPDKNAEIIIYCLSGARATSASAILRAMGYTNVKNMGGIHSWRYETERGRSVAAR